jgi:trimethylamine--corrinoid protein Co-methyltransferase
MARMLTVLSPDDIERIHQGSLDVLAETGIWFHDAPEVIELLEQHGCTADGFRVQFPRKVVEEALAQVPDRDGFKFWFGAFRDGIGASKGESHVFVIGNAYYLYDYENKCHRDCVEADWEDKWLVTDNLRHIEGDHCTLIVDTIRGIGTARDYGTPEACMSYIRRRVGDQLAAKAARPRAGISGPKNGLWGQAADEARLSELSHMVAYGPKVTEDFWARSAAAFVWCNPLSPLQFNPEESLGIIKVARDTTGRPRIVMLAPEVMMGATGPVTVTGALVQHNAEVLAGVVLAQLAGPGTFAIYGCVSAPMDMRVAEIALGSFEATMLNVACVQMADRYGLPSRITAGNTGARRPGVRAAVELMMGLYSGLAAGGNLITTGLLDATLMLSYEHLILLDEMIPHVRSMLAGVRADEFAPAISEIQTHGHPKPGFLTSDYTLQNMKRDIYYSDYSGRTEKSYEDWYETAHRKVQEIFKQRSSAPAPSGDVLKRLTAVEARLKEDMNTWRAGGDGWWQSYVRDMA